MKKILLSLGVLLSLHLTLQAQQVIPYPTKILSVEKKIDLNKIKSIYVDDKRLQRDAEIFNEYIMKIEGKQPLPFDKTKQNALILSYDSKANEEAYRIESLYDNSVKISGKSSGIFYGLMTVFQAMNYVESNLPKLEDQPSFKWRGMHLDVSRHFFDKEFVKRYIDLLALHKMNTFHWHLTDDQGWRIEIKQFPLLTSIGSKRKETMVGKNFNPYVGDGKPVQGFYTQEEIKEVVAYAAERHITIVPEIEMPGHALAALTAYPEYSCNKKPLEVMTTWGVSDDVFCPNDETVEFLKKILDEVLTLFPSKYIHIGGDEVPKTRWKTCPVCQESIHKNNLKDESELQSYFIKKMDAYLASKGRNTIGWDEILEGGIAPNAAIMSWRGEEGGIAASKHKHYVVMSPGSHCYFDHYQGNKQTEPLAIGGFTPIEKVYAYSPIPEGLSEAQQKYILGAQANVWTEYIPSEKQVEYMALPRMCALAEVLWSGKNRPSYEQFVPRLENHFLLLDKLKVNYSKAIYDVAISHQATGGYVFASLQTPFKDGAIYYTIDGKDPSLNSTVYTKRVFVTKSSKLKAQYFENGIAKGNIATRIFELHKAVSEPITSTITPTRGSLNLMVDGQVAQQPKIIEEYTCWKDQFPVLTVDLHRPTAVTKIKICALKELENNNYLPTEITLEVSSDGKNFSVLKNLSEKEINESYKTNSAIQFAVDTKSRYYRFTFENQNKLVNPEEKAWLLISEIVLQ